MSREALRALTVVLATSSLIMVFVAMDRGPPWIVVANAALLTWNILTYCRLSRRPQQQESRYAMTYPEQGFVAPAITTTSDNNVELAIDSSPEHGELWAQGNQRFLVVTCPSKHTKHRIRVPAEMQTAHEARAWTFGMTPGDFSPKMET